MGLNENIVKLTEVIMEDFKLRRRSLQQNQSQQGVGLTAGIGAAIGGYFGSMLGNQDIDFSSLENTINTLNASITQLNNNTLAAQRATTTQQVPTPPTVAAGSIQTPSHLQQLAFGFTTQQGPSSSIGLPFVPFEEDDPTQDPMILQFTQRAQQSRAFSAPIMQAAGIGAGDTREIEQALNEGDLSTLFNKVVENLDKIPAEMTAFFQGLPSDMAESLLDAWSESVANIHETLINRFGEGSPEEVEFQSKALPMGDVMFGGSNLDIDNPPHEEGPYSSVGPTGPIGPHGGGLGLPGGSGSPPSSSTGGGLGLPGGGGGSGSGSGTPSSGSGADIMASPVMKFLAPAAFLAGREVRRDITPSSGRGIRDLDQAREQAQAGSYRGGYTREAESIAHALNLFGTGNRFMDTAGNLVNQRMY